MIPKEIKKLASAGTLLLAVLIVLFGVQAIGEIKGLSHTGVSDLPASTISVSGEGEVFAVADIAEISFTVTHEADAVSEAQEEVTARVDDALAALDEFDIAERDIKTTRYNARPRYEYQTDSSLPRPPEGNRVLAGYEVTQTVSVKVRTPDRVGEILGALGDVDVDEISGPTFTIDDDEALHAQAREKAIANAREKAAALAEDLDVSLGRLVDYNEGGSGPMYQREMFAASADDAAEGSTPAIPRGENKISVSAQLTYEIK